jgi:hypothetical protein
VVGGLGRLERPQRGDPGQEKGDDTDSRIKHNFGMARPEGYRKAQRLMKLADRFRLPVVTLVDTPGAYPGLDAEARGQAEAIASSIDTCLAIGVPLVSVVIGEGGSGGALAIASADKVFMLENAVYSVITPEGCASILWRSNANAQEAAEAMKVTAQDLKKLEVIDEVHPRADGRRPSRARGDDRQRRQGDLRRPHPAQQPRPRHPAPTAPGQVPGDGRRAEAARPVSCTSSAPDLWRVSPARNQCLRSVVQVVGRGCCDERLAGAFVAGFVWPAHASLAAGDDEVFQQVALRAAAAQPLVGGEQGLDLGDGGLEVAARESCESRAPSAAPCRRPRLVGCR